MKGTGTVSLSEARYLALRSGGLLSGAAESEDESIRQFFDRIGVLQIDSINVFERSHYMPPRARFGNYDKGVLDEQTLSQRPRYIEYWAHMAAFIPLEDRPLFQWRMDSYRSALDQDFIAAHQKTFAEIRSRLASEGPLRISDFEKVRNPESWWGWSDVKRALEYLFFWGEVSSAGRHNFQRRYVLSEQFIPAEILGQSINKDDAIDELIRKAARAVGIGTAADIADHYRLKITDARAAIGRLVEAGELVQLTLESEPKPVYSTPETMEPLAGFDARNYSEQATFLSPFDPLVWFRPRTERLFDFHYRIEIYVPEPKRVFGYYSLPILVGEQLIGRADLKADRKSGTLIVKSAWLEDAAKVQHVPAVAQELERLAQWQGLDSIVVDAKGTMSAELQRQLGR